MRSDATMSSAATTRLVITRKKGQRFRMRVAGRVIWVTLVKPRTGSASLMIEAASEVEVAREEILPGDQQQQLQEGAA
jgi:sRNA-binding carbon storage regulator CsrA